MLVTACDQRVKPISFLPEVYDPPPIAETLTLPTALPTYSHVCFAHGKIVLPVRRKRLLYRTLDVTRNLGLWMPGLDGASSVCIPCLI